MNIKIAAEWRDSLEYPHDHAIPQAPEDDTLGLETRRLYH
jgi:hypothetical protein